MAKTNNKGFSLIEIVIAVAILSILLTPIIRQFANTMETSRKAKALQEANETASYEIEEFQSLSKKELDKTYDAGGTAGATSVVEYKKTAKLVDKNGQPIMNGTSEAEVDYTIYQYNLEDSKIGAKNDVYSNTVMLDDLSLQIRSFGGETATKHYKIAYGLTKTDLSGNEAFNDFVITNEGAAVEYDADNHVTKIVCTDKNNDSENTDVAYIQNPNTVNLGNMHDLDKTKMALILGSTSSYDSEAYATLFSKAMDHLKALDRDSWEQALLNVDSESILSQNALTSKRMIKIYADQPDTSKNDYVVKVDVYYIYKYSLTVTPKDENGNPLPSITKAYTDMITYTIYSQKFTNMEKAPEIYFEYQPYCLSGDTNESNIDEVTYQADDYIMFDNYVDECKLYLYKPYKDQMNSDAPDADGSVINDDNKNQYKDYDQAKANGFNYYTDRSNSKKKVTIHLASKTENSEVKFDEDGNYESGNTTKRVYIYTNFATENDIKGYREGVASYDGVPCQFVSDDFGDEFKFVKGERETVKTNVDELDAVYVKKPLGNVYTSSVKQSDGNYIDCDPEDAESILRTISDDKREEERLYTVTVVLRPNSNALNTIRLSGAKGAN